MNMRKNHLTLTVLVLIILADIGESVGQLLMKIGLKNTGIDSITFANLAEFITRNASSVFVLLGMLVYVVNFFIWITILSRIDLSVAVPVCSFSYIFIPILAMIFLHEAVSPIRWFGIILIIAGIYFVSQSAKVPKEASL